MWEPIPDCRCTESARTREGGLVEDEAAVIARVRAGEPEAYAEPVRAHTAVAPRAAVACGAGPEAEDVVPQAFSKAYGSPGRFQGGAAFRPWLLRIVADETRNTVRSAGRQRAVGDREADLLGGEPRIPKALGAPDAVVVTGSAARALAGAVGAPSSRFPRPARERR